MSEQCERQNIILTGMFGAGKSTIGVVTAKRTGRNFIDTDVLIQARQGRTLQEIVDADGYLALRRIEEAALISLEVCNHVIATGGSAVYSDKAMRRLKRNGIVVFLDVPLSIIQSRVNDFDSRGIARQPDQSFEDLYAERRPLYERYADITIASAALSHDEAARVVAQRICMLGECC